MERAWNVYLSGEIHSDWRDAIEKSCRDRDIPVRLMGPELDHSESDNCGDKILGTESESFWKDHKAAKINAIRTRSVLQNCDVVVVRFGEKYKQWNAAFEAGLAVAWGKSLITVHGEEHDHALKEVDAQALATTRSIEQVVDILSHVTRRPF